MSFLSHSSATKTHLDSLKAKKRREATEHISKEHAAAKESAPERFVAPIRFEMDAPTTRFQSKSFLNL